MQWSEVIKPPPQKMLRQFAGLFLVVFLGLAGWRVWRGHADQWAVALAVLAIGVGVVGLVRPSAVRFIYTGLDDRRVSDRLDHLARRAGDRVLCGHHAGGALLQGDWTG